MKNLNRNRVLFLVPTVMLGLASLMLYHYMMNYCHDEKGLLIPGNLPGWMLLANAVGFGGYLLAMVRHLGGDGAYRDVFPRCVVSGCMVIAAAVELALSVQAELLPQTLLERVLCWGAVAAMAVTGACRIWDRRPWFVFHGMVCLFYIQRMIVNYQRWSADPQLQDYAYQMMACAMLMLAAFHRTCCDAKLIDRKKLVFTGLAAAFCCLASLGDEMTPIFYLASGLWAAGSIGSLGWLPGERAQAAPPRQESDADAILRDIERILKENPGNEF